MARVKSEKKGPKIFKHKKIILGLEKKIKQEFQRF